MDRASENAPSSKSSLAKFAGESFVLSLESFALELGGPCRSFESNAPIVRRQRREEFLDGFDEITNLIVVAVEASFELREFRNDMLIHGERLAHLHERTHHEDAHFDGSL